MSQPTSVLPHACLLLAAGFSRRLGTDKALLPHAQHGSLLEHAVACAAATAPRQLLVVRQPGQALPTLPQEWAVQRIDCPDAAEGMAASLRCGVASLTVEVQGVLVLLLDQPALHADHLLGVLQRWRQHPTLAVASSYAGVLGAPALLPRSWFERLLTLRGDLGARTLLRSATLPVLAVAAEALAEDRDEAWQP